MMTAMPQKMSSHALSSNFGALEKKVNVVIKRFTMCMLELVTH